MSNENNYPSVNIISEGSELEGFLKSVEIKLSNKNFIDNAPKNVIDVEKKKRDDAMIKLENLKKSI